MNHISIGLCALFTAVTMITVGIVMSVCIADGTFTRYEIKKIAKNNLTIGEQLRKAEKEKEKK